jgi:hypothetical protein
MPIKYVIIKEIKLGKMRNGVDYPWILDHENVRWNLFPPLPKVEVGKAYAFTYEHEGEYDNLKKIEAVINIFKAQALKEIASLGDYKRDFFMSVSYAKDLVASGKLDHSEMYTEAEKIYTWVLEHAQNNMPKDLK